MVGILSIIYMHVILLYLVWMWREEKDICMNRTVIFSSLLVYRWLLYIIHDSFETLAMQYIEMHPNMVQVLPMQFM